MRKVLFLIIILSVISASCIRTNYTDILVSKVYDGDTFLLASGERVRLIGFDTPETEHSYKEKRRKRKRDPEYYQGAEEAKKFLRELVEGKEVQLEFDVERYDRYDRLLAYAWREIASESHIKDFDVPDNIVTHSRINKQGHEGTFIFINATMIKSGHALPMPIKPNTQYAGLFYQLYQEAKNNKIGF